MAKEYIEREAVLAEYDRQHKGPPGGARKIIEEFPAADVLEVVRGRWKHEKDTYFGFTDVEHRCSQCGRAYSGQGFCAFHFCPNCGADMREVDDDCRRT